MIRNAIITVKRWFVKLKQLLLKRVDVDFKLPDNRVGKWLNKDGHLFPKYFRESYQELKKVVWPTRKETWQLFLGIMVFSVVLGTFIALADYGFEKILEKVF